MRKNERIGVVIPALNEEQAIGNVIGDIPAWVDAICVVDNGSQDRTVACAEAAGAMVVKEPERGYGAACLRGIETLPPVDIIVFLDGDYSDHPEEMESLIEPILSGEQDFVVGSRVKGNLTPGALTPQQIFGNWLACRLMRMIWGVRYSDLGPFRAIRASALRDLKMRDRNYGWTVEMQIKAAERRLRSLEIPVSYRPRIGVSKVSGTVKGTVLAGYTILRVIAQSALKTRRGRTAGASSTASG